MRTLSNMIFSFALFFNATAYSQSISYYPKADSNQRIDHVAYSLNYSEKDEQAEWVAYLLTKNQVTTKNCERKDNFRPDKDVITGSAELSDYNKSGYDRGHLCPAADRHFSCDAMSETFFLSNMSPQAPAFNRGIWKNLEELIRGWAVLYENVFVVTGPVLNGDKLGTIGSNEVTVPKYYYKTVLRQKKKSWTCIAMVLPNEAGDKDWAQYVITVDSLESLTKIDFFSGLPDNVENAIESNKNINAWDFYATPY